MKSLLYLLLVTSILFAQCKSKNTASNINSFNKIDSLFNSAVNNQEIPGAVAIIAQNGKIIYHQAFGFRNMANNVEQSVTDIFRMASMTKGLTAISILQLYEKGLLNLDDEIGQYIPEFKHPQILLELLPDSNCISKPAQSEITIRQLLTHTSGIGYGFQDEKYNALVLKNNISEGFCDDNRTSLENILKIAQLPLMHEPGEKFTYGLSYDVLGVLIEKLSGLRFDEYCIQNILNPLRMDNSYFVIPEKEQYRLVDVYQPNSENVRLEPAIYSYTTYPIIESRQFFSAGADLCSTAEDYSKFVQAIANGGVLNNNRILGEEYVKLMLTKQSPLSEDDSYQGFAAWIVNEKGAQKGPMGIGSYGFGGFFDTYSWCDPDKGLVAVLLLQMYPGNMHQIHEKYQQLTYELFD